MSAARHPRALPHSPRAWRPAVTLDEFALWFDLSDDYWTPAGRRSVDAMLLFGGGLSVMGLTGRGLLHECGRAGRAAWRDLRF